MAAPRPGFRRNAAEVFFARAMIVVMSLALNVLVNRLLSVDDRGIFALAYGLPLLLQNLAGLGMFNANVYFASRAARMRDIVTNSLYLSVLITVVLLLLAWPLHGVILRTVLDHVRPAHFFILVGLMPFAFMDYFFSGALQGVGEFRSYNARRIVTMLTMLVAFAALVGGFGLGLNGAVAAVALTIVVTGLMYLQAAVRLDGLGSRPDVALGRKMLVYGGKSYSASTANFLSFRLDQYLLAALAVGGSREVAIYAVAVSLAEILWYIPDSIVTVLFPRLSATQDPGEIHAFTAQVCRVTVVVTLASAAAVALLAQPLILLLAGHRYLPFSLWPLWLLLPGAVSMAVYKILWRNFTGRDRQRVTVSAALIAVALNVLLNLWMIPRYGASGAAISSSFSYTLGTVILLVVFMRDSGIGLRQTVIVSRSEVGGEWGGVRELLARRFGGGSDRD